MTFREARKLLKDDGVDVTHALSQRQWIKVAKKYKKDTYKGLKLKEKFMVSDRATNYRRGTSPYNKVDQRGFMERMGWGGFFG